MTPDVKRRPAGNGTAAELVTGQVGTKPTCRLCPLPSCGYPPCRRDVCEVDGVCRVVDVYCDVVEVVSGRG